MTCKAFELKSLSLSFLNIKKEMLTKFFRQANYIYNSLVADSKKFKTTDKEITILCGDHYEIRRLDLGSGIKQGIRDKFITNCKSLKGKKDSGDKIGKLKFKSYTNAIPLRQYKNTYNINFDKNTIRIQCIKQAFKVRGLKQIPENAEICNAELIRKASGYYIHVVIFVPKENKQANSRQIGLDFGIKSNVTSSNGEKYDVKVPESKGTKLASRKTNHKKKGSKNRQKAQQKLRIAYEKDTNRKLDKAKKLVSYLDSYDLIAFQDENIKDWHKEFGKVVQHSAMGFIKAVLKTKANSIMISRYFPSTQICSVCSKLTPHSLNKRDYDCSFCGYHHDDRDVKAAQTILDYVNVSLGRRANSLVELKTSALKDFSSSISLDYEAGRPYSLE
jgi:transposase